MLISLTAGLLLAQNQGRLSGNVTDSTGAVIPGAAVTLLNVATGVSLTAETNESGAYLFPVVTPGMYELRVELDGFKTYAQSGLGIETGYSRNVDVTLEIGQIAEVVNVEASTPLLEGTTSSVGQFIERGQVFNMPVQSRRSASLVRLMGNITYRSEDGGEQVPKFSMAGGRSQNQMWTLDGSVIQNMSIGVPQLGLNPPAESLQEFKAEQNNYPAEFGRAGGGAIMMTTRSGTNDLHGAAYEFFRNNAMDSRSFFASKTAPLRYNIFGTSIGGPIKKNKSFFFFNYEGARRRDGVTYSSDDVPHVPEKSGDFSNRAGLSLKDPLGGTFANNIIPQARLDPIGRQVIQFYPDPNVSTSLAAAPANNYVGNVSNALNQNFFTGKWDHNLSDNDRLSVRFILAKAPETVTALFPDAFADPRAGTRANRHHNTTVNWIHNFSPTRINEFRFNWGDRMHINRGAGRFSNKNGELGIPGVNGEAFATFQVNGLTQLGVTPHERIQDPIRTIEITNNQTWIRGAHQIKYGGTMRYARNIDQFNPSMGGIFNFNNRATGVGTAELLLGHVNSGTLIQTDQLDTRTDYFGFFVQDDWKVTSKLSLNLGLRWEFDTPRWERNNHQSGFNWDQTNPVSGTPGVVTFAGVDGVSKYSHNTYLGGFGPRFGFAYQASSKTVLRGGYGINYYGAYAGAVPNAMSLGFSLNGSFPSPDGGFTQAFGLASGMPAITREALAAFGSVPFGSSPVVSPDYIEGPHRNAMAQQWNFGIQHQLGGDYLLEVTYTANMGHRLGGQNMNWNQIPLVNGQGPAKQSQQLRLFPQFNNVTQISPDWGNSSYNSGNVKLEKRYSNGFNMLFNYTYAKYLDDVEGNSELAGLAGNGYTHFQLRNLDRSYSGSDIRHRVAASAVYELPFGRDRKFGIQNRALDAIFGGWGLGVITEFRTGSPYSVIENTNTSNTYAASQRPNILGDPEKLSNWRDNVKGTTFFDTSLFAAPGTGIFGNAPRAVCCGPGFANIDSSIHKWFNFTERFKLQFRGDFYNVMNHANFASPGTNRGRGDFGTVSSVLTGTGGRVTQLALRFEF
ncbi:MAG: carboxypeptidase regulatory-like domain-containing protein [Bryobacterales bacterium]